MEKDNYSEQLKRLQEEQEKAMRETDERIAQWQTFKSDYEALKERLKSLPDKLSHEVMVPFGKMAFMPGKLVHTNEILVLLGDNWFVERSAKQAADIVSRRMKTVEGQLEDLYKQRKLLEPRREFTSELHSMAQGGAGVMDIKEEYDEEKERKWKETHKKNVQRHKQHLKKEQKQQHLSRTGSTQYTVSDEELWARLDQLEQIELEGREIHKIGTVESDSATPLNLPWSSTTVKMEPAKVSGNSRKSNTSSSELLDSDDDDDEKEEEEEEEEILGKGKVIHFHHTKPASSEQGKSSADSDSLNSPSDIYSKFSPYFGPRSILKGKTIHKKHRQKNKSERKVAFETDCSVRYAKTSDRKVTVKSEGRDKQAAGESAMKQNEDRTHHQTAFSGTVVEKSLPAISPQPQTLDNPQPKYASTQPDTKPVSRFKAKRLEKAGR